MMQTSLFTSCRTLSSHSCPVFIPEQSHTQKTFQHKMIEALIASAEPGSGAQTEGNYLEMNWTFYVPVI